MDLIKFGICIDDAWRYMGLKPPPSIVIPHIFLPSFPSKKIKILKPSFLYKKVKLNSVNSLAETLSKVKIDYVRFWLQWNFIQPKLLNVNDFQYNWNALDRFINTLKQAGIRLLPVVGCGYQRMLPESIDPTKNPNEYIKAVYESTREIVHRYKNLIKIWQIENEPNWWFAHYAAGWRKGLIWIDPVKGLRFKQMLLSSLKEAVKNEDGGAQIVINLEVDRKIKDLSFYAQYCDIIGLDYYPNYSHAKPIDVSTLIPKAKKIFEETGKEIIVCETGYPSGPSWLGYNKTLQAVYIKKLEETLINEDLIKCVFIWRLSDSEWRSFPEHENHFGLIEADGTPKPSWHTYLNWIKKFK